MDHRDPGAEGQLDHMRCTARAIADPAVPDGDEDVGRRDYGLADLDVGTVAIRPVAGQCEERVCLLQLR